MEHCKALFVDDDELVTKVMTSGLEKNLDRIDTASSYNEAVRKLTHESYDVVITDLCIGTDAGETPDGISLVKKIKELQPDTEVILQTGFGSIDVAVKAMRAGALDYVEKPYKVEKLQVAIEKAMENRRLRNELASLRQHVAWEFGYDNITGDSNALRHVKDTVARLSETDLPVLITGEPGVGKELFAKAVHFHSRRRKSPLMTINCSTHPTNLIDSELFGASRSLYSSTTLTKRGLLEQADGGAIIIDEIAKLPLESQTKLMRVIDNSEITTTGPGATRKVHVRIIATTSHDLARDVADGAFREDLYARLKSVPLHIPALRDRKEDIPLLVERFLRSTHSDKTAAGESLRLSRPALEKLIAHNWPGNVRELESTIRRARALARNAEISADDIFFVSSPMISPKPAIIVATTETAGDTIAGERGSLELTFRNRIIKSLEDNDWNFTQTATELGIGRTTLWRKVKKYNLKRELIQS